MGFSGSFGNGRVNGSELRSVGIFDSGPSAALGSRAEAHSQAQGRVIPFGKLPLHVLPRPGLHASHRRVLLEQALEVQWAVSLPQGPRSHKSSAWAAGNFEMRSCTAPVFVELCTRSFRPSRATLLGAGAEEPVTVKSIRPVSGHSAPVSALCPWAVWVASHVTCREGLAGYLLGPVLLRSWWRWPKPAGRRARWCCASAGLNPGRSQGGWSTSSLSALQGAWP